MTRFIITRHGQSIANAECRFAGQTDFDLSKLGYAQAECVGKYISQNFKIDHIYSSDLIRAYNTAMTFQYGVTITQTVAAQTANQQKRFTGERYLL